MRGVAGLLSVAACLYAQPVEFNRDIRPILSDKCYTCHGPDQNNRKANLRLDQETSARPAIPKMAVRVSHPNKAMRMPPPYSGLTLSDREIETIERWIQQGAVWQKHWSLIPPKRPAASGIDEIVRARLAREGLQPSPEADRATLIRRVSLDLTGIPPTPAEVDAFLADQSRDAYEKLVDRLLASPRYGERMAVRWLDAARYADTNGYQTDAERYMWRWRDWVIDAFNRNMPFDRFTVEQIAGDLLPNATLSQKIATGFNRNHRGNGEGGIIPEEYAVEYVVDRVDTTAAVFLGITLGCARCHDHKYDPFTQKEYYQVYAYFNSIPERGKVFKYGNSPPLIPAPTPDQQERVAAFDAKVKAAEERFTRREAAEPRALAGGVDAQHTNFGFYDKFTLSGFVDAGADGALITRAQQIDEGEGFGIWLRKGKLQINLVKRWLDDAIRVETEQPFTGAHHIAMTYDGTRVADGIRLYIDGQPWKLRYLLDDLNQDFRVKEPLRVGSGVRDVRVYREALYPEEVAVLAGKSDLNRYPAWHDLMAARHERRRYLDSIPTVMIMQELPAPRDAFILKRGAYDHPGEKVTRATPAVLHPLPAGAPNNRLGFAQWLVSPENPLTARVIVNRFWQMYFGTGIVKTVEDFGSQGEWPSNPELLDWLATEFVRTGWDVKALQKTIVMSATYRQSSRVTPELLQRDPENRLLAHASRFRLPAEMVRDQALAVSGLLVEKIGGPSVKPWQPAGLWKELSGGEDYKSDTGPAAHRRSLYTFWKRAAPPPMMMNFDAAGREACVVRLSRTNTPLQALDLMNDAQFLEAARALAEKYPGRPDLMFRAVTARWPTEQEKQILMSDYEHYRDWSKVANLILNLDEVVTRE